MIKTNVNYLYHHIIDFSASAVTTITTISFSTYLLMAVDEICRTTLCIAIKPFRQYSFFMNLSQL